MKKFIKNFVLTALIMSIGLIISCVQNNGITSIDDSNNRNITIKIEGDENLLSKDASFSVKAGTRWKEAKTNKVIQNLKFSKNYTIDTWKLTNSDGEKMMNLYPFYEDTTIYAVGTKNITIQIDGDKLLETGVKFTVKKDSLWSEVKNMPEVADIQFKPGYTLDKWKLNNSDGQLITDDTSFTDDTNVIFAVAKSISENVTITIQGENLKNGTSTFSVSKGTRWSEVKNRAEIANVQFEEHCTLDVWKIGKPDGKVITDVTEFNSDTVIYAVSSEKVTITIQGENLKNGTSTFSVPKGTKWSAVKNRAEIANVQFEERCTLDVWKIGKPDGKVITDVTEFNSDTVIYAVSSEKVTITVQGDNLENSGVKFSVKKDSKWSNVKNNYIIFNVKFKDGYTLDEWKVKDTSTEISDITSFTDDTIIYAVASKKITIRIDGEHLQKTGVSLTVKEKTKWSEIKKDPKIANIQFKPGYTLDKWKLNNSDGQLITDDTSFTDDTNVIFAVAKSISENVTITIQGENLKNGTSTFSVSKGTRWSEVKTNIEITGIECAEGYAVNEWKLNDSEGDKIIDTYPFYENTTIYAVAKNTITVHVIGGKNLLPLVYLLGKDNFDVELKKGATLEDLMYSAVIQALDFKEGYGIYGFRKEENGEILEEHIFTKSEDIYLYVDTFLKVDSNGAITGYTVAKENLPEVLNIPTKIGRTTVSSITKAFEKCKVLKRVTVPKTIENIGERAFDYCTELTKVIIPNSIKKIESNAFHNCMKLAEVTIPEGVTEIGENAFNTCKNIKEIIIPKSVSKINAAAFGVCTQLKSVIIKSPNCEFIKSDRFNWNNHFVNIHPDAQFYVANYTMKTKLVYIGVEADKINIKPDL